MLKRATDITLGLIALLLLSPVIAVIAAAVWCRSGSPILFQQERIGKGGRGFILLKFRTMESAPGAESGRFDLGSVRRVTRIGRLLRKTKLDELPQLWNVICGDMSLVGPRPEVRKWVDAYPARWAGVHRVRPGITDPAAIEFRNEEEMLAAADDPERMYRENILPRKLDLYEAYIQRRSFWGDVAIIFRTLWAVLAH